MLAYATHLLQTEPVREARIHPDGQRARQVDFRVWLEKRGFRRVATARTPFAGTFEDAEGRRIVVHPLWPPTAGSSQPASEEHLYDQSAERMADKDRWVRAKRGSSDRNYRPIP
jgi:hypothetical protein